MKKSRTRKAPAVVGNKSIIAPGILTAADIRRGVARQAAVLAEAPLDTNRALLAQMKTMDPRTMDQTSVEGRLQNLLGRAKGGMLNAVNAVKSAAFIQAALDAINTKESQDRISELVTASIGEGQDARVAKATLGKMVAVNVGELIRAAGDYVQWYEWQTLAEGDTPWLSNFVPQQVNVRVANADGTLTTRDALPNVSSHDPVPLYFLLSDMFRAKLFDPNKGNVANAALATVDIAMDVMEKLDGILQLPFTVGTPNSVFIANFVNDGTAASHFHLSARINAANLPAGNLITLLSNGANTVPRFDVIRAIDEYYGRFGSVMGNMGAAEIRVASGIAHQFGNEFTPTSTTNPYTDSLFTNRGVVTYNGKNYPIVPDPTISPTDPHVYVRGTLPAGIHFDKPAGAMVHREENIIQNEVSTCERILVGQAFPLTWAPRVLAVRFKN